MKLFFVGDSITRGTLGAGFIQLLKKKFPQHFFVNGGQNGNGLFCIGERLAAALEGSQHYDWVFMQGGCNDVILPLFLQKGKLFQAAYRSQLKKGHRAAADELEFIQQIRAMVQQAKHLHAGEIALFTIGVINEIQQGAANDRRLLYNQSIRRVAAEENVHLVDAAAAMERVLQEQPANDYLMESFWAVTLTDRVCGRLMGWNYLSRQRKLNLTIDGVHLNDAGAELYAQLVTELLQVHDSENGKASNASNKRFEKERQAGD